MVLVKNLEIKFHPFFLGIIVLEKEFGAVRDRKEPSLDYKNIDLIRNLHSCRCGSRGRMQGMRTPPPPLR